MYCVDVLPLAFAADPYKKAIEADKENTSVRRIVQKDAFWEQMVKDVADAWKAEEVG